MAVVHVFFSPYYGARNYTTISVMVDSEENCIRAMEKGLS
jgi:hypothetical protein